MPQPDGPRTAVSSRAGTSRSTPCSTVVAAEGLGDTPQRQGGHAVVDLRASRVSRNVAGQRDQHHQRGVRGGRAVVDAGAVAPELRWPASAVPIGASSSVAVSSVATARKTSAAPAPRPGAISGSVTRRNVADRAGAEACGHVVEHRRRLRQRGPQADHRPRQEQDRVGREQQRDGLVERRHEPQRHRHQRQRDDDAGQRAAEVGAALERGWRTRCGGAPRARRPAAPAAMVSAAPASAEAERGHGGADQLADAGTRSRCRRAASAPGCPAGRRGPGRRAAVRPASTGTASRPSRRRGTAAGDAAADPGVAAVPAQPQLGEQQQQAAAAPARWPAWWPRGR